MTFYWPNMLWLLLIVPILVLLYLYLLRRKKQAALKYASLSIVKEAMGAGPGFRRHIPPLLLLLAVTTMIIAMARPAAIVTLPSQRDSVILAMDISGSMRAGDVDPNRITASQEAVKSFIAEQPRATRLGVVAFAGTAMMVQQPTLNRDDVIAAVERFRLQWGTNIGGAILTSLQTIFPESNIMSLEPSGGGRFQNRRGTPLGEENNLIEQPENFIPVEPGSYTNAAIILLTDGQATTGPDPVEMARMAADRGVRVFTVGFGSREGDTIGFGGRSMRVQLDEETLRQIAEITRGRYFHAGSASDLGEVYKELTTQFVMETELTEITAFFSGFATLLLLISAGLSLLWYNRIVY